VKNQTYTLCTFLLSVVGTEIRVGVEIELERLSDIETIYRAS